MMRLAIHSFPAKGAIALLPVVAILVHVILEIRTAIVWMVVWIGSSMSWLCMRLLMYVLGLLR
jgi:hypothetical protein